jgi:hypothetical protein
MWGGGLGKVNVMRYVVMLVAILGIAAIAGCDPTSSGGTDPFGGSSFSGGGNVTTPSDLQTPSDLNAGGSGGSGGSTNPAVVNDQTVASAPEPGTWALLLSAAAGFGGFGLLRRKI